MLKVFVAASIILSCSAVQAQSLYVDQNGNPVVTQENIHETICVPGWTKTIRPPASYTTKLKIQQLRAAGLRGKASDYEEDHVAPLCIGGNPTDPNNLRPQLWKDAHEKDDLERFLCRSVCDEQILLKDAQQAFFTDWRQAYNYYILHSSVP